MKDLHKTKKKHVEKWTSFTKILEVKKVIIVRKSVFRKHIILKT